MNYPELVALMFPLMFGGCSIAVLCNLFWKNELATSLGYSVIVIVLFQHLFWGKASIYQWHWYLLVSGAHVFAAYYAHVNSSRSRNLITLFSCLAITLNMSYLVGYFTIPLPRQGFFLGMSTLQALQIITLISYSPAWPLLIRTFKFSQEKKDEPWVSRLALD